MRRLLRFLPLMVALLASSLAQTPSNSAAPAPKVPADLDGRWVGTARRGPESAVIGFEFERKPDGRVLAKLWLPEINAYGTGIDWLAYADGKFNVAALGAPLVLEAGTLRGQLFSPEIAFTAQRGGQLPAEPLPPAGPTGPAPAWTYRSGAKFWSSPVVADGIAYLGDTAGKLHAVRVRDGTAAWTFDAHAPIFGNVALTADAVFVAADNSQLFKLARAIGAELWHVDLGGGDLKRSGPAPDSAEWDYGSATPVVFDGVVYAGSVDGSLRAIDAATGRLLWRYATGDKLRAATLATADRVYVGSRDHFLYALDRRTGALVWRFDTGSPVTTAPVLADGKIVIGTRDKAVLYALDAATGRTAWSVYYWMSWVESAPVLVDGVLYIGSSDSRRVRALDPATGRTLWSTQVWGWTWGTPLVVDDTVYYATAATPKYFVPGIASIGALDRRTGRLKWRRPLPYLDGEYVSGIPGSLAGADGRILAANRDGTLTAFPVP